MLILGHRGCMGRGYPPENTLGAFKKALECGADGVELDVHLSRDNVLMVIHDKTLKRTTSGSGRVADRNAKTIQKHDAGQKEYVPTLVEVLDLMLPFRKAKPHLLINIELKGAGTGSHVCDLIEEQVANKQWSYENFLISSFDFDMLKEVYRYAPHLQLGALWEKPIPIQEIIQELGTTPYSVNPKACYLTKDYVKEAKNLGIKTICWGLESKSDLAIPSTTALASYGVEAIITNEPDKKIKEIQG